MFPQTMNLQIYQHKLNIQPGKKREKEREIEYPYLSYHLVIGERHEKYQSSWNYI